MIGKDGTVNPGDFSLSRYVGNNVLCSTPCGSPCYGAPEIISGDPYDCFEERCVEFRCHRFCYVNWPVALDEAKSVPAVQPDPEGRISHSSFVIRPLQRSYQENDEY